MKLIRKNKKLYYDCKCECGNERDVVTSDLTLGCVVSCGCLKRKSRREELIDSFLSDNDVSCESEYRFEDCKNDRCIPFDFYLPTYNTLIEYDGEQHFRPVDFWGGEEAFKYRQQNDEIKNKYCKENNITLLRLPYTLTDDEIKEQILNILNPVTITA